jgi:hypothetical protein
VRINFCNRIVDQFGSVAPVQTFGVTQVLALSSQTPQFFCSVLQPRIASQIRSLTSTWPGESTLLQAPKQLPGWRRWRSSKASM